jgi:pimeloyl-ACP methyl ester carboxylesterase
MNTWSKVEAVLTLRDLSFGVEESTSIGNSVIALYPPGFSAGQGEFVILVHGYNVSQEAGRGSYARFRWWLEHFEVSARILELHWPGDRKWGLFSGLCYPAKIETAVECGKLLARWLSIQHPEARVTLVGHSLGCRLVLEAIKELRQLGQIYRLLGVCLMAAAVPARFVTETMLGPRTGDRTRWRILYSRGDRILSSLFPLGQAGHAEALFGYAVGLHGDPAQVWRTAGDAWELYQETGNDHAPEFYNHGYYWQGGPEEYLSEDRWYRRGWIDDVEAPEKNQGASSELVAETLGARVPRRLPLRALAPAVRLAERFLPLLASRPF